VLLRAEAFNRFLSKVPEEAERDGDEGARGSGERGG